MLKMTVWPSLPWIYAVYAITVVTAYSVADPRSNNDISYDYGQLDKPGRTNSLAEAMQAIAEQSYHCVISEIPKMRRKFLSNDSITCNDGSPAGYYIQRSYGSKKWIVFLEGGWYCFDHVSCQMRWANSMKKYMSSKHWPKKKKVGGILSRNVQENPYYFHSNMVYIPYCSSDSWSGAAPRGDGVDDFAFMGSLIVEQVIRDLIPKGLKHGNKLILAGSSAGGTGVLINLDRVAGLLRELAPGVEVKGVADSGWFLDYPQYKYKDCVEALSCAPMDGTKRGIKMWQGRVPESCKAEYPESEHWRCYFGYRMYPSLKTPLYVIQNLFDEAQILVDNVFEQSQLRNDNSAAHVTKSQWEYLHRLGEEVRSTLLNVSAVFAPACLSHEVLLRPDWYNVSSQGATLGQSIYCWENNFKFDNCITSTERINSIELPNEAYLQGDAPKVKKTNLDKKKKRRKKNKKKKKKKKQKKQKKKDNNRRRREKERERNRKRRENRKKRRKNRIRRNNRGACPHHLIDTCPLPQCNLSCPKYRNRFTGSEIDLLTMFVRYGINKKEIADLLGKDLGSVELLDDKRISLLLAAYWQHVGS